MKISPADVIKVCETDNYSANHLEAEAVLPRALRIRDSGCPIWAPGLWVRAPVISFGSHSRQSGRAWRSEIFSVHSHEREAKGVPAHPAVACPSQRPSAYQSWRVPFVL